VWLPSLYFLVRSLPCLYNAAFFRRFSLRFVPRWLGLFFLVRGMVTFPIGERLCSVTIEELPCIFLLLLLFPILPPHPWTPPCMAYYPLACKLRKISSCWHLSKKAHRHPPMLAFFNSSPPIAQCSVVAEPINVLPNAAPSPRTLRRRGGWC